MMVFSPPATDLMILLASLCGYSLDSLYYLFNFNKYVEKSLITVAFQIATLLFPLRKQLPNNSLLICTCAVSLLLEYQTEVQ